MRLREWRRHVLKRNGGGRKKNNVVWRRNGNVWKKKGVRKRRGSAKNSHLLLR
jgi:hypothetical protein